MDVIKNSKNKSEENNLIYNLNKNISNDDSLSIMANSASLFLLNKLDLNKITKVRLLISDANIRNFFDEEFDYTPEEKIGLPSFLTNLIDLLSKETIEIKRLNSDTTYGSLITNKHSYMIVNNQLDAKRFGFSNNENDQNVHIQHFENTEFDFYKNDFEKKWQDKNSIDITTSVKNQLEKLKQITPENLYYFLLQEIFSNFPDITNNDKNDNQMLENTTIWKYLYKFQKDAVVDIRKRLERYGICILADSVGLGKTFTALGIIKDYQKQGKRILVLCPKKLQNNWEQYLSSANRKTNILNDDNFDYTVLFHTDLLREDGERGPIRFADFNWGNFGLVVIDESHNFRNGISKKKDENGDPIENRYSFLINNIIKGESKPKLLLLSATPVNNKFQDLANQLRLAYDGEENVFNKTLPIKSRVETLFKTADKTFKTWIKSPEEKTTSNLIKKLDPDFINLIDTVSIARSRNHIKTFYNTNELKPFPKRRPPLQIDDYNEDTKIIYEDIAEKLTELTLFVYTPYIFIKQEKQSKYPGIFSDKMKNLNSKQTAEGRAQGIVSLMRSNLLKRLESSSNSFKETLERILAKLDSTIEIINNFEEQLTTSANLSYEAFDNNFDDSEEDFFISDNKNYEIDINDIDYKKWKSYLLYDQSILSKLSEEINSSPDNDNKLCELKKRIQEKIEHPINTDNKKIIVFTAFSDTAKYLYENLADWAKDTFEIQTALITGSEYKTNLSNIKQDFDTILTFFSPKSKNKNTIFPESKGEIDLLIATDCISEGQNLQDCDYLINYDIHWNPVRIIQRFGRIDRIGSDNKEIQLVNFWPSKNLDFYLKLKKRVEARMVATILSSTGDENILKEDEAVIIDTRAEQIRKIIKQEEDKDNSDNDEMEKQELENLRTQNPDFSNSFTITDFSLSGYRTEYQNFSNKNEIEEIPNGFCIQVKSECSEIKPGAIFIFKEKEKNDKDTATLRKTNPLYPFLFVYLYENNDAITNSKTILSILREICTSPKTLQTHPVDDIIANSSELLQKALGKLNKQNDKQIADSLFSTQKAPENTSTRQKELICYIIIK